MISTISDKQKNEQEKIDYFIKERVLLSRSKKAGLLQNQADDVIEHAKSPRKLDIVKASLGTYNNEI